MDGRFLISVLLTCLSSVQLNKNSAAEGAALSLHVALPSSPFDNVTVSYDTGREIVTRMRPQSQSQVLGRFAQGSVGDIGAISESTTQLHQDSNGMRSTKGDAGRMNCFTCVEDDVRDDEDEQEPMEREEEEEDMPFAWVDHSTILSQNFDCEFKPYGDMPRCDGGAWAATTGRGAHDLNATARPAGSQRGSLPPSHDMPPVLMSFPDAPWSESGSLVSPCPVITSTLPELFGLIVYTDIQTLHCFNDQILSCFFTLITGNRIGYLQSIE